MCDCRVCRGPIRAGVRVKYNFNTSRVDVIGFLRQDNLKPTIMSYVFRS